MSQEIKDLSIIKKEHIEVALLKYKELENKDELNLNRKSKNYILLTDGNEYYQKYLIGIAYGIASGTNEVLDAKFYGATGNGKSSSKKVLNELGYSLYEYENFKNYLTSLNKYQPSTIGAYVTDLKRIILILQKISEFKTKNIKEILEEIIVKKDKYKDSFLAEQKEINSNDSQLFSNLNAKANEYLNFLKNPKKSNKIEESRNETIEEVKPQNIIYYGPPGTGKTYITKEKSCELCNEEQKQYDTLLNQERIDFVTFHQSYDYEQFIEGISPKINDDDNDVSYELKDGIFKKIALLAASEGLELEDDLLSPQKTERVKQEIAENGLANFDFSNAEHYVLIIDEINRGNISRILGELITIIEPSKRIGEKDAMLVSLPYSQEKFAVPPNLHIIGTMNTADRSIALMDVALRRRFKFTELMPKVKIVNKYSELENIGVIFETINKRIKFLYDREHQLGHSIFMNINSYSELRKVMLDDVIPMLQEYFYSDWNKICAVLGCPYNENGTSTRGGDYSIITIPEIKKDIILDNLDKYDYENKLDYEINPNFISEENEEKLKEYFDFIIGDNK